MIILQNVASGAPWTPRYYLLDRKRGNWKGIRKPTSPTTGVAGLGSCLLEISGGWLSRKLLALYFVDSRWMIFDGSREFRIEEINAVWKQAVWPLSWLGLATLTLQNGNVAKRILYFRPALRHWFEGGWALDDVDIASALAHYVTDESARHRLLDALTRRDADRPPR